MRVVMFLRFYVEGMLRLMWVYGRDEIDSNCFDVDWYSEDIGVWV